MAETSKIAFIYCLTNRITGKKYIGFTTNIKKRMVGHKCDAKRRKYSNKLGNAIKKYGLDAFDLEILYCSKDIQDTLYRIEPLLIAEYNTRYDGYNTSLGGDKANFGHTFSLSESAKEKIRKAQLGHIMKPEAKLAICKTWRIIWPDGKEEVLKNLYQFCRDNNLSPVSMSKIAKGKLVSKTHKGFGCCYA